MAKLSAIELANKILDLAIESHGEELRNKDVQVNENAVKDVLEALMGVSGRMVTVHTLTLMGNGIPKEEVIKGNIALVAGSMGLLQNNTLKELEEIINTHRVKVDPKQNN